MPAAKHFASKRDVKAAPTVEFSIDFVRNDVAETHEFVAHPRTSYGDVLGLIKHQDDESGKALPYLDRMIRRALDDKDGVPLRWKPSVTEGRFTAPDGTDTPVDELSKFQAFEAGSSRRRWAYLMEKDDEVEVELDQIAGVFEYLAGEAAENPTSPS